MVPKRVLSWFSPLLSGHQALDTLHFKNMMKESKVRDQGDDRFWTSNAALVACLFQIKVILPLKIMRIYNEPLLSGQPPLSWHLPAPRVAAYWRFHFIFNTCKSLKSTPSTGQYFAISLVSKTPSWRLKTFTFYKQFNLLRRSECISNFKKNMLVSIKNYMYLSKIAFT